MSGTSRAKLIRNSTVGAAMVVAIAVPLSIRVGWEGRAELDAAAVALGEDRLDDYIVHLGRAARWRMPMLSHDEEALAELMAFAQEREGDGEQGADAALAAYREVRHALLGTRTWTVSDPDLLDQANARIAALMADQERRLGMDSSENGDPESYHRALLDRMPGADPSQTLPVALAFLVWIGACVGFVLRAIDGQGRLKPRAAMIWGTIAMGALATWLLWDG